MSSRPYAVILAGGGGTRLWPLSRPERPKPFLPLLAGGQTPLAATLDRLLPLVPLHDVYVVAAASQVALVRESLPQLDPAQIVAESASRNTGPAVALATAAIRRPDDAPMLVVPADHAVLDAEAWRAALATAVARASASSTSLVTLGVVVAAGEIVIVDESTAVRVVRIAEPPRAEPEEIGRAHV